MTEILCHVLGLDIFSKKLLISNFGNNTKIDIIDLDELNEEIFKLDDVKTIDKKIFSLEKKKILNKLNENENETLKFYKKKLTKIWKSHFISILDETSQFIKKDKIIIIGNNYLYNNIRVNIPINSKLKFVLRVNYDKNSKTIIESNLNTFREEIINGKFQLQYLSKDFLIKKRKQMEELFKKKNYSYQFLDQIIFTIKSNLTLLNNLEIPKELFYASYDLCKGKICPLRGQNLICYYDDALPIISLLENSVLINNEIKIHDKDKERITKQIYLYKVDGSKFTKYNGLNSSSYITTQPCKIIKTIKIKDILNCLTKLGYDISYLNI